MPAVTIPGVGRVNFPDTMSLPDIQAAAQKLAGGVGRDPNTGAQDPTLAMVDAAMTGTVQGKPIERSLRSAVSSIPLETSLPIVGSTIASMAFPPLAAGAAASKLPMGLNLLSRGVQRFGPTILASGLGGGIGGAAAEAENVGATPESIARAGLRSGAEMAAAEGLGLGVSTIAARAFAPGLRFLDPLKGVRQTISQAVREVPEQVAQSSLMRAIREATTDQGGKSVLDVAKFQKIIGGMPEPVKAAIAGLLQAGRFAASPVGGEVAEALAVPAATMLGGPSLGVALMLAKAALNPGPVARYLSRTERPNLTVRTLGRQGATLPFRAGFSDEPRAE